MRTWLMAFIIVSSAACTLGEVRPVDLTGTATRTGSHLSALETNRTPSVRLESKASPDSDETPGEAGERGWMRTAAFYPPALMAPANMLANARKSESLSQR